ncbi:SEL1-like repeat protein [Photobacterium kasasachensis]|uniref:SEL1-like repeat protein n=1 Tax=Photobacterium kasasachensis TaxID=2910240 RepID=UPI003D0EBF11
MKRIFSIATVLSLVGCTSIPEVEELDAIESVQIDTAVCSLYSPTLYSEEFLQGDFFDAWKYEKGIGREINIDKAMALYKKSVDTRK